MFQTRSRTVAVSPVVTEILQLNSIPSSFDETLSKMSLALPYAGMRKKIARALCIASNSSRQT
jgi:hypothetical protein